MDSQFDLNNFNSFIQAASQQIACGTDCQQQQTAEQLKNQIREDMKLRPLYTSCNGLKLSLDQDEEENPDNSIKEFINLTLNSDLILDKSFCFKA